MIHNLIHCPHCGEDMNPADWNASKHTCLHCGEPVVPLATQNVKMRRLMPLVTLRKRLQLQLLPIRK
jgi:hypothetical protein